jgi:hypothetical protein
VAAEDIGQVATPLQPLNVCDIKGSTRDPQATVRSSVAFSSTHPHRRASPVATLIRFAAAALLALVAVGAVVAPTPASAQPIPGAERTAAGKAAYRAFVNSVRGKPTLVVAFHPL